MKHECAHQNGRCTVTGDTQRQHGDHSCTASAVVGRFRNSHALDLTLAERFRVLGRLLDLLVVNVFMYIVGTGLTRFYAHITRIPYEILAPIVLTFCIAGSYSTNNRIYDIYIILIFGIVSYFLRRMGFQLVPILLGIVLGPLAEKNFRRAMVISEGSFSIFFTRPISCAFILIAIVSVAIFGIRNYKSRKLAKQNTAETSERK